MFAAIPLTQATLNSGLTLFEEALNLASFTPLNSKFSRIQLSEFRYQYGKWMTITSLAVTVISLGLYCSVPGQAVLFHRCTVLGLEYTCHGLLNIGRYILEDNVWTFITLPYDLCGLKFLQYANVPEQFHIQARLFSYIKGEWIRFNVPHVLPALIRSLSI